MTAEEKGAVNLIYGAFSSDKDLHLSETYKTHPNYEDMDIDKDGYVDGTNIKYDSSVSDSGVMDSSTYVNLNPIKRPGFIRILNNDEGYDYLTNLNKYLGQTTFLNETEIIIGTTDANGNLTVAVTVNKGKSEDESPVIPFD